MNSNDKPQKNAPRPSPKQQRADPREVRWLTPEEVASLRREAKEDQARLGMLYEAEKSKDGK